MAIEKGKINSFSALMLILGSVVGTGIFFNATIVLDNAKGNGVLSLLAWLVSGLMAIAGGLTIAELGVLYPENSGLVVYLEKTFGKKVGFLAAWMQMVLYCPSVLAAISLIFGKQFTAVFNVSEQYTVWIGIVALGIVILFNVVSLSYGVKIQNVFTILKFIPIVLIIIFGLCYTEKTTITMNFVLPAQEQNTLVYFGGAMLTTLFAYDGWLGLVNVVGKMENPKQKLPKVFFWGISIVTIIYVLINLVYLLVATPQELLGTSSPGLLVGERLFGTLGNKLINIGILISVFGSINGMVIGSIAVPESMIKNGWLPVSRTLKDKTVTMLSGLIIFVIATVMMLSGTFGLLMDLSVFSNWVFVVLAFVAVIILRVTKKSVTREYKVPLYPVVPIVAILGGLFILVNAVLTNQAVVLYFVIFMLTSIPFMLWQKI